jgi:hypothetical protein
MRVFKRCMTAPTPASASVPGDWPPPLDDTTPARQAAVFDAQVEVAKKRDEADSTRAQAEVQAELDLNAEYYKSIFEVGKGTLERSRAGAASVQTAASAIVTLYTGLLAVSFSVASRPLPPRGAVPAIMLGLAIVFATFYLAYLGRSGRHWVEANTASSLPRTAEQARAVAFLLWMRESALRRAFFLRAAVIALGFGVMLLPAAFISLGEVRLPVVHWTFGSGTLPSGPTVDWPGTPTQTSDISLQRILYAAQVKEAAAQRTEPAPTRSGADDFWFVLLGVAIFASVALAALGGRGEEDPRSSLGVTPARE